MREIPATFEGTILALGQALELRDDETKGHTGRVVACSRPAASAELERNAGTQFDPEPTQRFLTLEQAYAGRTPAQGEKT